MIWQTLKDVTSDQKIKGRRVPNFTVHTTKCSRASSGRGEKFKGPWCPHHLGTYFDSQSPPRRPFNSCTPSWGWASLGCHKKSSAASRAPLSRESWPALYLYDKAKPQVDPSPHACPWQHHIQVCMRRYPLNLTPSATLLSGLPQTLPSTQMTALWSPGHHSTPVRTCIDLHSSIKTFSDFQTPFLHHLLHPLSVTHHNWSSHLLKHAGASTSSGFASFRSAACDCNALQKPQTGPVHSHPCLQSYIFTDSFMYALAGKLPGMQHFHLASPLQGRT